MITKKHLSAPVLYNLEELEAIDTHITKYFGQVKTVFHEFFSEDIHVDVSVMEPHAGHEYYTLVTTGMGAYQMNIPKEYLADGVIPRSELLICLPPDWNPESKENRDMWPMELLRYLARFPIVENTWLAYGHTIDNGRPYADNTLLSSSILLGIQDAPQGAAVCTLKNGNYIAFYQVIPLTKNELNYKVQHGTNEMLEHMEEADHVVNFSRPDTDFG